MNKLPHLALMVGVIGVSFSSILIKNLPEVPALVIAAYRMGLSTLILGGWAALRTPDQFRRFTGRDLWLSGLAGVFLAAHFVAWFTSLRYTSIASSVALVTLQPIFVLLGGRLWFGEKTTLRGLAGIGLAMVGAMAIGYSDSGSGRDTLFGDMLALIGAALVAGYFLVGRSVRRRVPVLPYAVTVYGFAALTLVLAALAAGVRLYPYGPNEMAHFLALAVIPTILGHTLFNYAIGHLPAATVSSSILGEPVGAAILAFYLLGETPTAGQVFGGLTIISGLGLFVTSGGGK